VEAARPAAGCDLRIHCRFEADNLDALEEVLDDIAAGRVDLLAYNDHTPSIVKRLDNPQKLAGYASRAGCGRRNTLRWPSAPGRGDRRCRRRGRASPTRLGPPASRC
jgi:hypothetical protein